MDYKSFTHCYLFTVNFLFKSYFIDKALFCLSIAETELRPFAFISEDPYFDIVSIGLLSNTLSYLLLGTDVTAIVAPLPCPDYLVCPICALVENDLFFKFVALVLLDGILLLLFT